MEEKLQIELQRNRKTFEKRKSSERSNVEADGSELILADIDRKE
jgi:hypothetical protein